MSDSAVVVRLAMPSDEAAVRACVMDAYQPYVERMPTPPAPMLDDYQALISRQVVYVAEVNDDLAGVVVLWPADDHVYVDNVAVARARQGEGFGRVLLDFADAMARDRGLAELRLYTNEAMTENLSYYPRIGFLETHRGVDSGYRRVYFTRPVTQSRED